MCIAVPGKIISASPPTAADGISRIGTIDFQGSRVNASLVLTPEARPGDWVLVHAGFAIQLIDEKDALETWEYLSMCNTATDEDLEQQPQRSDGKDGQSQDQSEG